MAGDPFPSGSVALYDAGASARTVVFAVVVRGDQFAVFVDQKQVAQITESRESIAGNIVPSSASGSSETGRTIRIVGTRHYDLP